MSSRADDIGAYFVLSHGSEAIASPAAIHGPRPRVSGSRGCVRTNATITARPAAISGYTVKVLSRYGAVRAIAAQANVVAPGAFNDVSAQRQAMATASAPIAINITRTPS